jgi:nucleotide-sensitive chloride channel 1A
VAVVLVLVLVLVVYTHWHTGWRWWMLEKLAATRSAATGLPALEVDEEVRLRQGAVQLFLTGGAAAGEGEGELVITTRHVIWLSSADGEKGYKVDFPTISLHAISRDPASFPMPCVYCQLDIEQECMMLDGGPGGGDAEGQGAEEDVAVDETSGVSEARFVPSAEGELEAIFKVFCDCALLNPSDDEESADGDAGFFTAESLAASSGPALGTAEGNLAHYDRLLAQSEGMGGAVLPVDAMGAMALSDEAAGMFDDAEEDETSAAARSSWPEVVGQDAGTAMAAISAERPDLSVERVEEGAIVTMDFREDRVRVYVGADGSVGMEPKIG